MQFSFTATIYKTGINLCVDVPAGITKKMIPEKGYIPVQGKIRDHDFLQTLVPVKGSLYRLYVNGPMLKGSRTKLGDQVKFTIEQDETPRFPPMNESFRKKLIADKLLGSFNALTAGRQKEILRYLGHLKTEDALKRNINKVIAQLKNKS